MMPFAQQLYTFVAEPLMANLPKDTSMIATDDCAVFVPVKVTLMAAFLLSFAAHAVSSLGVCCPALYQNEKRLITPLVLSSVTLFFVGMAFAHFLVFPVIFKFLAGVTPVGVNMATDIDKYLSFILGHVCRIFGTTFEVPVVVVLLAKMGALFRLQA